MIAIKKSSQEAIEFLMLRNLYIYSWEKTKWEKNFLSNCNEVKRNSMGDLVVEYFDLNKMKRLTKVFSHGLVYYIVGLTFSLEKYEDGSYKVVPSKKVLTSKRRFVSKPKINKVELEGRR